MNKVILDAGHGQETDGKRSPIWEDGKQLLEWEFNRDIVKRIAKKLDKLRIPYHILTPEDRDISLGERVRRANAIYAEDKSAYLISVHANAGGGTGWEAFTDDKIDLSDDYCDVLYRQAEDYLEGWRIRTCKANGRKGKEEQFFILKNTKCPAVLTENLFMDNEKDCRFIMSDEGRDTIAQLHVDAIVVISKLKV